ncbi:hypothetical protein [Kitasatospora sp. NBC_01302]|uniref:hypothetical protein n=1 Tax=Kitasatospora sp. NBC_01302 TaxID=2903575 RepID=UPI002E0E3036|nr:hypothetical protein OG294_19625 [Kitasatospora sp. NBC_01302]
MPGFLERAVGAFFDKHGDEITDQVRAATAGMPVGRAQGRMRGEHDAWVRSARLGRPYWAPDARWIVLDDARRTRTCYGEYVFTRRSASGLHTAEGLYSWDLWFQHRGLLERAPQAVEAARHGRRDFR